MQQLQEMGFAPSKSDSSLFAQPSQTGPISILLYVDDLVIADADLREICHMKSQLATSFDMKDLGDLHYFLEIEVINTPEGILSSQRHYVLSMLFKLGMIDCKSISTPLDKNMKLRRDSGEACDPTRFRQIVGSTIYLTITRSDLSYPVFLISQFMSQPKVEHLQCAQRILRYVSGTKDRALLYQIGIAELKRMSCGSKNEDRKQKERIQRFNGSLESRTVRGRDRERETHRKTLFKKCTHSMFYNLHVCVFNAHFYTSPYKD